MRTQAKLTTLLLRRCMRIVIPLHSIQELLSAFRMVDVLYTEVDTLFNVAIADDLVYDHTDRRETDVVYNSSPPLDIYQETCDDEESLETHPW